MAELSPREGARAHPKTMIVKIIVKIELLPSFFPQELLHLHNSHY